ncbi:50S ribosomal protein L24 [Candidatus Falkowbacteria bacterium CG10_big_fil_rev_8_21_14_0_10_43_10]|uniref:Large ribosomal subunit protein uL24 n=1 Tax=Candidatus Falkowbacteria bacterium CG10_big_fil_rev_8_21_14_0_10_43_10 TaxID=1974567 RepID=A0A2H0V4R0_9BACT|nr:MAG: 50S ribosomal protein L24 [Candidatus Falkowbacteria bacterium CG10_big_fil_rev_8_21_14_0_10_43_10]
MKIKTGDKIKIISGKDKGKTGKVLQVFPSKKLISVEGRNLLIKHLRPRRQGEKGQRVEFPAPFNISNAMLICPKCGKASRLGYKITAVGAEGQKKKVKSRICKKCKQVID